MEDNAIHAHIFGRSRRGDREEAKILLFNPDGTEFVPGGKVGPPGPKGDPGPPGEGVSAGPLAVKEAIQVGSGQDGPIYAIVGNFPNAKYDQWGHVSNYSVYLTLSGGGGWGVGIVAFSPTVLFVKVDNTAISSAYNGQGSFKITQWTDGNQTTEVAHLSVDYWYFWEPQLSRYYNNSGLHAAGTTIVIARAQHGLSNYGSVTRGIFAQVQDKATGAVEIPQNVVVNSTGQVTITFAGSVAANSKIVTLIAGSQGA